MDITPSNMEAKCKNCRFFHTYSGICRRYPPFVPHGEPTYNWKWPIVNSTSWCGEFQEIINETTKQ